VHGSSGKEVRRQARQTGDRHAEGAALVAMGQASWLGHHFDQSLGDSRQAAEIAEAIGAPSILAGSLLNEAIVYEVTGEVTGRLAEARTKFDRALVLSRQLRTRSTRLRRWSSAPSLKAGRVITSGRHSSTTRGSGSAGP
jgi:hypothetical protein